MEKESYIENGKHTKEQKTYLKVENTPYNAFKDFVSKHPVLQYNTRIQGHQSYHDKDFGDLEELLYTGLVDWILRAHAMFLYHISHNLLQFLPKEDS